MVGRDKEGGRVKPGGGGDDMERGSGLIYGKGVGLEKRGRTRVV